MGNSIAILAAVVFMFVGLQEGPDKVKRFYSVKFVIVVVGAVVTSLLLIAAVATASIYAMRKVPLITLCKPSPKNAWDNLSAPNDV